ncbi:T-complex protein 11-domain-containing protein [Lipomyces arxii]|uniref:T-complex protein 11-domain-containing protein n=1 Tax=Lipomyces arxii TaxID=56418 RepID=UPI0034CFB1AC
MNEHQHHHRTRPPTSTSAPTTTATPPAQSTQTTQTQQQHHHLRHDDKHTTLLAAVAAVSQPGAQAGQLSDDTEKNYQAGCEDIEQTTQQPLDQASAKTKRPFAVAGSIAKRAKLEHVVDQCDTDFESESETPVSMIDDRSMLITPPSTPAPSERIESVVPSRTAYRRMRSKSLPDISLLSLYATASMAQWPTPERRSRRHRHYHHHRSNKQLPLVQSPACAPVPANFPPVNLQGLRELDLPEIYKNPQLRHDIVFDPQLQFRPNLDGERGRKKKLLTEKYWSEVVWECRILIRAYTKRQPTQIKRSSNLVGILISLREVLISLLPARDRSHLEEVLDIELQIQQLEHVTFDFIKLANWLARAFKAYCAPMRDPWVDQMLVCIRTGVEENNAEKLVDGLRMIFTILEAMKLDDANHQIRSLRPNLVGSAVEFEQDYFAQKIQRGKINISSAMEWYKSVYHSTLETEPDANYVDVFVSGLISLFSSSQSSVFDKDEFPVTFAFDNSRLRSLKSDIGQITCLQQCLTLFRQLIASCAPGALPTQQELDSLKSELLVLVVDDDSATVPVVPSTISTTDTTTSAANNLRWPAHSASIALQVARHVKQRYPDRGPDLQAMASLAEGWLNIHLNASSSNVFTLVEGRILADLERRVKSSLESTSFELASTAAWKSNGNVTSVDISVKEVGWSQASKDVAPELSILAGRIGLLGDFHWSVFAGYYMAGVMSD